MEVVNATRIERLRWGANADKWDWKILLSVNSNSRYKSGGICFVDNQLYWAADANEANRYFLGMSAPFYAGFVQSVMVVGDTG